MNVLWVSNGIHTPTGYGSGTKSIVPRLLEDGHPTKVLAYWGISGSTVEIEGIDHIPPHPNDLWGNAAILPYAKIIGADVAIVHRDIWVNDEAATRGIPTLAWFPVDHSPISRQIRERLAYTRWAATMSRWGVQQCEDAGYEVFYLPHSVDPVTFTPDGSYDRRVVWGEGIPADAFVITMVAANKGWPPRKGWQEAFQAVAAVQKSHPDVWLYLHTNYTAIEQGPDLTLLGEACGLDMRRVHLLNPHANNAGLPPETLAQIYRCSNLFLSASHGEGFGIPLIEAQSCGTRVVAPDNSSQTELVLAGTLVETEPVATPHYGWWGRPIVGSLIDAIEAEYVKGERCRAGTFWWYDDNVYDLYWRPFLQRMMGDMALDSGAPLELEPS